LTVYIIMTTRDKLLPHVAEGLGDIAAGNITVTEERRRAGGLRGRNPASKPMRELIVTGPTLAPDCHAG
jgi:hypothetical protein